MLDYGCGPGSYSLAAAEIVGPAGKVYALDVNPLAARRVRKLAARRRLGNVETILSGCRTELASDSIDLVLLYDTLHVLDDPAPVLSELHRVLKPTGALSVSDDHMRQEEMISSVTGGGPFRLMSEQSLKGMEIGLFAPMSSL